MHGQVPADERSLKSFSGVKGRMPSIAVIDGENIQDRACR